MMRKSSSRVWHTHELALAILAELNQVDLLTLSLVSKHLRFLSLSRLLHSQLDIPLSRVASFQALLEHNPTHAQQLRHLSLYDDILPVRLRVRARGGTSPFLMWSPPVRLTPTPQDAATAANGIDHTHILALDKFLRVLGSSSVSPPPPSPSFSLTIGLSSVTNLAAIVQTHPFLADHLTTLQIIVDHVDEPAQERPTRDQWHQFVTTAETHWANLVQLVKHVQSRPHAAKLHTVAFVDPRNERTGHWYAHRRVWDALGAALSGSVRSLAIRLGSDEGDHQRECSLLKFDWPHLRSFSFTAHREVGIHQRTVQDGLTSFLIRHAAHLEHLYIDHPHSNDRLLLPTRFPKLQSCEVDIFTPTQLRAFIEAHKDTLVHVRFPQPLYLNPGATSEALPEPLVVPPNLVSFRGPPKLACAYAEHGPHIRHFHLDGLSDVLDVQQLSISGSDERHPVPPSCTKAVTCLDLQFHIPPSRTCDQELRACLTSKTFPNLIELRIQFRTRPQFGEDGLLQPSPWIEAETQIKGLLNALRGLNKLAALRLGMHALPPPSKPRINITDPSEFPPALQFLIFHPSATPDEEHYFAVQHRQWPPTCTAVAVSTGHGITGGVTTCLRRFQPVYRGVVAQPDDVCWRAPSPVEPGLGTLFDHTRTPPILLLL